MLNFTKKRIVSLVLVVAMLLGAIPADTFRLFAWAVGEDGIHLPSSEKLPAFTNPFTPETKFEINGVETTSQSYRIPNMVTLADGTIVAATDIRWNTTYDGGCLDTLVATSKDGGATWSYTVANYLGDNGNAYNALSTAFIDSSLLVAADGKTIYMLCDLYAGGVALNGNGQQSAPATDIGFNDQGYLKLAYNFSQYTYYLKDGKIYADNGSVLEGYTVDAYYNLYQNGTYVSNLFFQNSPIAVVPTGYLHLTKSTDGGATWSEPTLLNLKTSSEQVCLASPGNALTTTDGVMVFPVYSYNGSAASQKLGFVYSTDNGATWQRSTNFDGASTFSSESSVVELDNGNLRFFYRNQTEYLCYVDYDKENSVWGDEQKTTVAVNSNTQLSAITHSETVDGEQVILVSCPTGPKGEGSSSSDGSYRTNGKIHVFIADAEGNMDLMTTLDLFENMATGQLSGSTYTEAQGFFAYSSMTERSDGSIAILYENNQFGWGAGQDGQGNARYFTITGKSIASTDFGVNPPVPQLVGLLRTKVRFAEAYLNGSEVVDFLYNTPGYEATAMTDVPVSDLPVISTIVDTYYTSEDEVYFKLEGANGYLWPGEYGNHCWVSADLLELVTVNYTDRAPFGPPVEGQSMAVFARNFVRLAEVEQQAERLDIEGVETKKVVTPTGNPGEYKVTLEVYVTGQKTTVTVTEDIPTDIVLVLDQSGSMSTDDFKKITGYQAASGSAKNFQDTTLYAKVGDEYVKVTVTVTKTATEYQYTRYKRWNSQQNRSNNEIYNYSAQNTLYYQTDGGEYWPIQVTRSGSNYNYQYTYEYLPESGDPVQIGEVQQGYNSSPDYSTFRFYTRSETTAPTEYTFSYKDADGNTQSETFAPDANITANKYYTATVTTTSRLNALKDAVTAFADSVYAKAKGKDGTLGSDDDVNHRIAVVGFGRANYSTAYLNTEVFIGANQYKYGTAAQGQYANAFQDMSSTTGYNNVIASKNALAAEGGTYVDLGIEMANGIFAANPVPAGEKRNRVVIVFTDGDPGYNGSWDGKNYGNQGDAEAVADRAIANATTSKGTYGATVYTVGIFNGADAETRPVSSLNNGNQFMHYVSSNYTGGTSFDNPGNASFPLKGSYYLSANNSDDLTGIFQQISDNVESGGASTQLDETTVVRDIVSPNFVVPEGITRIEFFTQDYTGENTWADKVAAVGVSAVRSTSEATRTTTVDITGFDFSENYVGTETENGNVTGYRGKKLVIEFIIEEDPNFLGGSNVDTNGVQSGVYDGTGRFVEQFEQPKVDVALKQISTVVDNKYIYLGNTVDLTEILNLYVKRNDQQSDLRITVDGINNAYVNLEYTITLNDSTVAVYTIPAGKPWAEGTWAYNKGELLRNYQALGDTTFAVTCVMTDKNNASNQSDAEGDAMVYIYKPTVTFEDSVQNYKKPLNGGTVYVSIDDFLDAHLVDIIWTHENSADIPGPEGAQPDLIFDYNYATGAFDDFKMNSVRDVPVNVIATIDGTGTDITDNSGVTYVHEACGNDVNCGYPMNDEEFIVHVINALTSLTIRKEGWQDKDPNQTFLFTVTGQDGDGQDINVTVTVHENGSVTIDGLVIGNEYTITEDVSWSWRYDYGGVVTEDGKTTVAVTGTVANGAKVTLGESNNVITFTNTRTEEQWLDGDIWCDNLFK